MALLGAASVLVVLGGLCFLLLVPERWLFMGFVLGVQLILGAIILYAGRAFVVIAWHDYPAAANAVAGAALAGLVLALLVRLLREEADVSPDPVRSRDEDEGGGGGTRRLPPEPPAPPAPSGDEPDWSEFDEVRRGWERTPVA